MNCVLFLIATFWGFTANAVTSTELANGLKLQIVQKKDTRTTHIRIWIRAGSAHELEGKTNAAHVIEHLLFGRFHQDEAPYFTQIKRVGQSNANTRHLATVYQAIVPADQTEFLLKLEGKRFSQKLMTSPQQLTKVKSLIQTEHSQNYGQIPYQLWREFYRIGFRNHAFQSHTSGYKRDLAALTVADIKQFFDQHYQPRNACLVVVSPLSPKKVQRIAQTAFATWRSQRSHFKRLPAPKARKKGLLSYQTMKSGGTNQAVLLGYVIPEQIRLTAYETDFLNHLFVAAHNNLTRRQLHFEERSSAKFGELNYNYDWYNFKVMALSPKRLSSEAWQKSAMSIGARMRDLSSETLEFFWRDYWFESREKLLSTKEHADWLGRMCGKYQEKVINLQDRPAFRIASIKQAIAKIFNPNQLVVLVHDI